MPIAGLSNSIDREGAKNELAARDWCLRRGHNIGLDTDCRRMLIRVDRGKGGRDRNAVLSPESLIA